MTETYDRAKLVNAWLTYQRHWWAYQVLDDLLHNDASEAWAVICQLTAAADSTELLESLGAGPLEDFLEAHGAAYIEAVEALAKESANFREALKCVWLMPSTSTATPRLVALGCTVKPPCAPAA